MAKRIVGNFRSATAKGASVKTPRRDRERVLASTGRVLIAVIGLALTFVTGLGVKQAFIKVNNQKITKVQIEGALHFVSEAAIKDTVDRFVETSLVALDLGTLKAQLEQQPWIKTADVTRQWPDKLIIRVEEQVAIARWRDGKLLNRRGQVFEPDSVDAQLQLPYLSGPDHSEQEVMQQYQQFNQLLYPLGVRISDLELNERGAWSFTFSNGVTVKVGRDDVLERMRRLVTFMESGAGGGIANVVSIDLRYPNGLAVAPRAKGALSARPGSTGKGSEIVAR